MILIIFVFCISYENNDLIQYFPIYSLITKLFSKGVATFSIVLGSIVVLIIHLNYIMTNVLTAFSCQRTFVIFYLLNSDITRGVVHNYAFSCIHRHIGCRQRKCAWNLDGAHAVVVNAEPLLPYTVDLFCIEHFDFFH